MTNITASGSQSLISSELESIKFGMKEILKLADDLDRAHDALEQDTARASYMEETNSIKVRARRLSEVMIRLSRVIDSTNKEIRSIVKSRP